MINEEICADGQVRYWREDVESSRVTVPKSHVEFNRAYQKLSHKFFGELYEFAGKEWSARKLVLISKALELLRKHKISDVELFLYAQFQHHKINPRATCPSVISSSRAINTYHEWLRRFASEDDAKGVLNFTSLEDLLRNNHKKFEYYASQLNWTVEAILRTRAHEFDPLYLLSIPQFLDIYARHPNILRGKDASLKEALAKLERSNQTKFLEMISRIKCQTNSTFCSKTK